MARRLLCLDDTESTEEGREEGRDGDTAVWFQTDRQSKRVQLSVFQMLLLNVSTEQSDQFSE